MIRRTIVIEGVAVPAADHVDVYRCNHCRYPHLVLRDEGGKPIAEAVLGDDMIRALLSMRARL